jgi:4-alpha-glucanotransferase
VTWGQQDELAQLRHLATVYNVQTAYHDLSGTLIEAPSESVVAVLRAMGALDDVRDLPDALDRFMRGAWEWHIEPVIVAWDGVAPPVRVRLPAKSADAIATCAIGLEDGETREWQVSLGEVETMEVGEAGGVPCTGLDITIDQTLPSGYHRFAVEVAGNRLESLIISAPRHAYRAPDPRAWGVFLPLYALHTQRSWGVGDFTDLRGLVEWVAKQDANFVATLPLLATFLDRPYDHSPYAPVSRLFWNEVFLDPEAPIPGGGQTPKLDEVALMKARQLTSFHEVPYRAIMGLKRHVLEAQSVPGKDNPEYGRYLDSRPIVGDYAAFRAAVEGVGANWREWPEEQRRGHLTPQDYDADVAAYHAFAQWRAETQVDSAAQAARERDVRLYLDLPVGVHPSGYDAWRYQHLFAQRVSVGAPPDLLAAHGQNWGFEPVIPGEQRKAGYDYLIAYLRHHLRVAGMLRVDHAIGLHRIFWIPEGMSGETGVFVRQHFDELYAILCLESHRHESVIVGENLGLVPPEVNEGMREHGIAGMYVQMFNFTGNPEAPIAPPESFNAASFATHDLPPFAAYWTDADLRGRERLHRLMPEQLQQEIDNRAGQKSALLNHLQKRGLVSDSPDTAEVFRGAVALLAESDAAFVSVGLEDAWGETQPQNIPGTTSEQHSNWTSRAAHSLEEFDSTGPLIETLAMLRKLRGAEAGVSSSQTGIGG